jgi:hypothetical protein
MPKIPGVLPRVGGNIKFMKKKLLIGGLFLSMMLGAAKVNASCQRFRLICHTTGEGHIGYVCGSRAEKLEQADFYYEYYC